MVMKLFLASEIKNSTNMKNLEKFVDGFEGKTIAYIATAANGEKWGSWKGGGTIQEFEKTKAQIDIIEFEVARWNRDMGVIENSDIIFLAGGMTGYLLYWLRRVGLDKRLPVLLKQGKILVGSSSGSMACGYNRVAEWFIGEEEVGAGIIPGLGLVNFDVYPHYREDLLPQIKQYWKRGELYLLKDNEAITVVDEQIEVLGQKRVICK